MAAGGAGRSVGSARPRRRRPGRAAAAATGRGGGRTSPASAPTCTEMIGVPTSTVVALGDEQVVRPRPSNGLGSSTTALAVSISTMIWLMVTLSPGCDQPLDDLRLGQALADVGEPELLQL